MAGLKFSRRAFSGLAFALAPIPPTESYVRMMLELLPPGKLWRRLEGSVLYALLFGSADELWRVDSRAADLVSEADPRTATELLPDYERELGLDPAPTTDERRARIIARTVQRQRIRPVDFQTALAPLLGQDSADVVVIERTHAFAVSIDDDREIFRFFIYRDPSEPGTYFLSSAQEQVDRMAPSHTIGTVIESVNFLCDDPFSLCDRDLLGFSPSFVGASTAVTSRAATITLATPAGVQTGDTLLLLAFTANLTNTDVDTSSLPAGWSLLSRIAISSTVAVLARRIVVAGEPASHVFPLTATGSGQPVVGVIAAYRDLDPDAALVAASASQVLLGTSFACPSLTVTAHRDLYIGWCPTNSSTATAIPPAGTSEHIDQGATQDGVGRAVMFDFVPTASGATGTKTATMSALVTGMAAAYALRIKGVV